MARDTGLSLMSAADGAMKGMQLYSMYQDQKDRKQMRGLRDMDNQRTQERHDVTMRGAEQDIAMRGKREERDAENNRINRARALMENQELTMGIMAKNAYAMEKSGYVPEFSKEEMEALDLFPQLRSDYDMTGALQVAEEVITGKRNINSPEALESINVLFPEIQTGADDGRKRRVTQVVPGKKPNTLVFGLEVEGDTQTRPLTVGRSSDDNDPVKQVSVEDMVKKVASLKQMNELKNNPKFRQFLIQRAGLGGGNYGDVVTDEKTGLIGQYEQNTNKFNPLGSANGAAIKGGRGAGTPADYQLAKLIQQEAQHEGRQMSFDQAFQMAKTSVSDPARYVSDYVKSAMDAQEYADKKKTPQQLEQEAIQSYQRIRQFSAQGTQGQQPENGPTDVDSLIDSFLQ